MKSKKYIITGAPGTGKTSVILGLSQLNSFETYSEVARDVIKEQQNNKGLKTPWQDVLGFTKEVFLVTLPILKRRTLKTTFCDRGLLDLVAYLRLHKRQIPAYLLQFPYQEFYQKKVFITTPWQLIYVQDAQRQQSFKEAEKLHELLVATYKNKGFELIFLPQDTVENRIQFIINHL